MTNLIRTEWLKIRKYRAFWWMTGIVALTYPGISYLFYKIYRNIISEGDAQTGRMLKMLVGNPFAFPEAWHTIAYVSSIFVMIPSIVVIMFITNEYTYKTHRQNIIDGWSRRQFMTSKLIDVAIISLLITLIYSCTALVTGAVNAADGNGDIWGQSKYIPLFFLQTFSQLSLAFLIAFLTRKAFIALGIFLFYFVILENAIVGLSRVFLNDIGRFMPLEISDRLIPPPAFWGRFDQARYTESLNSINYHIVYTFLLLALTWALCYRINSRRDL